VLLFLVEAVGGSPIIGRQYGPEYDREPVFFQYYEETEPGYKKVDPHRLMRVLHKMLSIFQFTLMNSLGLNRLTEENTYQTYYYK